jgi:hypothetical protein
MENVKARFGQPNNESEYLGETNLVLCYERKFWDSKFLFSK